MKEKTDEKEAKSLNFIEQIITADIAREASKKVSTRFPPEPNGYLHIGHAKSICLNFGLAEKFGGSCNLRFDDTNPSKESVEFVDAIKADVKWLGYQWAKECYASDYFDNLYDMAVELVRSGKAYVDDQPQELIAAQRGVPTKPGTPSPFRDRSPEENLQLLEGMKNGDFPDGSKVLRAKIDMASPNMHLRDPAMYRIRQVPHHRTGDQWNIYPMYDWAHGQSDAIEEITYSVCTLEFANHRPLYDWFIEQLSLFQSRQIEFARLNLSYTVTSKRKLQELVASGVVNGWDDPRMPTISGMRRRGYPPAAIRNFCDRVGVAKRDNVINVSLLEFSVREELNKTADRKMGILRPLKVVITNYPEDNVEQLGASNNPEDPDRGTRELPFGRELFIEQGDFMVDPPNKFFRLGPGREVRLKYAYIVKCEDYELDELSGEAKVLYCTFDPETKSGHDTTGKKVKGTLGWVHAPSAVDAEVRLYDRLFQDEAPGINKETDFMDSLNPQSLEVINNAKLEAGIRQLSVGEVIQFERQGYFSVDPDTTENKVVFNRTVGLKDNWAKANK